MWIFLFTKNTKLIITKKSLKQSKLNKRLFAFAFLQTNHRTLYFAFFLHMFGSWWGTLYKGRVGVTIDSSFIIVFFFSQFIEGVRVPALWHSLSFYRVCKKLFILLVFFFFIRLNCCYLLTCILHSVFFT